MTSGSTNAVSKYFDRLAPSWGSKYERSFLFRRRRAQFEDAIRKYARSSTLALDYGCGSGALTPLLCNVSLSVHATDLSERMRQSAADRLEPYPNARVFALEELPAGPYDLVLCSSVIEYVDDDAGLVELLAARSAPGAILLMTFANRWGLLQNANRLGLRRNEYVSHQKRTYDRAAVERLLAPSYELLELSSGIGLPVASRLGAGELLFAVGRRRSS